MSGFGLAPVTLWSTDCDASLAFIAAESTSVFRCLQASAATKVELFDLNRQFQDLNPLTALLQV
jgi:hypothetical protein